MLHTPSAHTYMHWVLPPEYIPHYICRNDYSGSSLHHSPPLLACSEYHLHCGRRLSVFHGSSHSRSHPLPLHSVRPHEYYPCSSSFPCYRYRLQQNNPILSWFLPPSDFYSYSIRRREENYAEIFIFNYLKYSTPDSKIFRSCSP